MLLLFIFVLMVILLLSGLRIAQEYQRAIVFRLGRFQSVKGPGLYWLIPFIERQQKKFLKPCNALWPEKQKL
jgi:regulator of protease activity HflC (stomatin/prohibitin superfamily)